ncbi:MAG TPA: trypsin-like serine protease [Polyangiales bacterium]|nr:trypsin-like serine protease [Polyangiales bacterium]
MGLFQRISALAVFTSVACMACANATDAAEDAPPRAALSLALPGASEVDFDVIAGTEKIRNGSTFGFWGLSGNSTVLLVGPTDVCTAQVINKYFLLTAAHCIVDLTPTGADWLRVIFTDTSSNQFELATVAAFGAQIPDWRPGDNDIGLYYLVDGIDTCQDTLAACAQTAVNRPVNAAFQVYYPGLEYTASHYYFVGYGTEDNVTADLRLRIGNSAIDSSVFTADGTAHKIRTTWSGDDARTCKGDSGSPLINTQFARLVHTGVHSSNGDCTLESGNATYAGLSNDQAIWVLDTMASASPEPSDPYHCGASTTEMPSGTAMGVFGCDNNGSVY